MPWEKSFDVDDALDRATNIFWTKGYEATSMSDLVDGMGINKGSLYNAFGSKRELFTRVLLKYDQDKREELVSQLEKLDDPVAAIEAFFDTVVSQSLTDANKRGCLVINTVLEFPNQSEDIQRAVTDSLGELEGFFLRMIKLGQKRGDIPAAVKASQAAKSLLAMVVGLRLLARGVFDAKAMRAAKSNALKLIAE